MASTQNFPIDSDRTTDSKKVKNVDTPVYINPIKLTKLIVDKSVLPDKGQAFIRDAELKGFALRLTPGSKSFIVEKRVDGKVRRMTLGRYPELTVELARKEAHKLLGQIATGVNPIAEKEAEELKAVTLSQAFEDFLKTRKNLRPKTIYDYRRMLVVAFDDWQKKPLLSVTKDMIAKRHTQLGEQRGEAYANLSMRVLRAIFNFAQAQYEDSFGKALITENPVARLTQTRAWYRVERRQTIIKISQLPAWSQAVEALRADNQAEQSGLIADYLLLLLFTGLRRQEAARIKWQDIDLSNNTLTIPDTKNRQPLTLPLSDFVKSLLVRRQGVSSGEYVFAGNGKTGYMIEPRAPMTKVMIASGVQFTLHDLRRTFITVAESLEISAYAVKRLVNHKMSGDVTAGYIITDVERLRDPMQRITDHLLKCMGVKASAKVIALGTSKSA